MSKPPDLVGIYKLRKLCQVFIRSNIGKNSRPAKLIGFHVNSLQKFTVI